jgi:hypothetical protein
MTTLRLFKKIDSCGNFNASLKLGEHEEITGAGNMKIQANHNREVVSYDAYVIDRDGDKNDKNMFEYSNEV